MTIRTEIKFLLSNILNKKDKDLRVRTLQDALELLSESEFAKEAERIENALKFELAGNSENANEIIEEILSNLDEE